jgi:hypothetical protein
MEKVVFSKENDQVIQQNNHFFTRTLQDGEYYESGDFNSLERAKESLGILPSVEDNNKLIAVFMGYTYITDSSEDFEHYTKGDVTIAPYKLKYNVSWDWLMAAVEYIENLEYIDRMGRFNVNAINFEENYTCVITDKEDDFIQVEGEDKITATYNAVVEFIKWHNNQKN